MSSSFRIHRLQHTRLLCPPLSFGCAVLSRSVMSTLCNPIDCSPPGSSVHGDSPGKNTGVGCHALLQGIFPTRDQTQVSCIVDRFFTTSHLGNPRIWKWVAYPFSRGSSQSRNQTRVSCIAGRFFTSWATREALSWALFSRRALWKNRQRVQLPQ